MRLALKNDSLCALDFQLLQFSLLTLMKWASFNPALLAFFSTSVVKRTSKQRLLLSVVGKAFFELKIELDRIVDRYFETLQPNNAKTFTMLRQIVIGGSPRLCEKKISQLTFLLVRKQFSSWKPTWHMKNSIGVVLVVPFLNEMSPIFSGNVSMSFGSWKASFHTVAIVGFHYHALCVTFIMKWGPNFIPKTHLLLLFIKMRLIEF